MISFVCWKWRDPRGLRPFTSHHVNVWARAIGLNYRGAHRLICITDEPDGLDPGIEALTMPRTGFERLMNPSERAYVRRGRVIQPKPFPSCYRRLWNFSHIASLRLGPRICAMDLDVIFTGDITALVDTPGTFVAWSDPRFGWHKIAGGIYVLETGAHQNVWADFDPERSPEVAKKAGFEGSDQAWMSYKLYPAPSCFPTQAIAKLKWLNARPLHEIKLVFTSGDAPPWHPHTLERYPWIKDYWR